MYRVCRILIFFVEQSLLFVRRTFAITFQDSFPRRFTILRVHTAQYQRLGTSLCGSNGTA